MVTKQHSNELRQLRLDVSSHLPKNFDFSIKRLRLSWYSQGNKPSKVLANHYIRRVTQSKISYLNDYQGHRCTNPLDIAMVLKPSTQSYTTSPHLPPEPPPSDVPIQSFLLSVQLPSITPSQLNALSQPFTELELKTVIKYLPPFQEPRTRRVL